MSIKLLLDQEPSIFIFLPLAQNGFVKKGEIAKLLYPHLKQPSTAFSTAIKNNWSLDNDIRALKLYVDSLKKNGLTISDFNGRTKSNGRYKYLLENSLLHYGSIPGLLFPTHKDPLTLFSHKVRGTAREKGHFSKWLEIDDERAFILLIQELTRLGINTYMKDEK